MRKEIFPLSIIDLCEDKGQNSEKCGSIDPGREKLFHMSVEV
jgi:hypothetical protein